MPSSCTFTESREIALTHDVLGLAKQVIAVEVESLARMGARLDESIVEAVSLMLPCEGRVVVIGMGKSGIIGRKIAATFASTGTSSFFVHPGEAFHGDLGMVKPIDVALMISNSGETEELIRLLPFFQHQKNKIVAMTGVRESTLAKHADVVLDVSVEREACNHNLAPTSSTTATLVMGDVLAVVLSTMRGFQPEDFARFHPGGSLGRRLLTRVADVMHSRNLPRCTAQTEFKGVVQTISRGRLGIALVVEGETLVGVITDGDLRRALERGDRAFLCCARDMMSSSPHVVSPDERFALAEERMRALNIKSLVVVDENRRPLGVLQIFDA
jgi:arabinose-5-phosphate isomerase